MNRLSSSVNALAEPGEVQISTASHGETMRLDELRRHTEVYLRGCDVCQKASILIEHMAGRCGSEGRPSEEIAECSRLMDHITRHLRGEHGVVLPGHYLGVGLTVGTVAGILAGVFLLQFSFGFTVWPGFLIGPACGFLSGFLLDRRARREGRVLLPVACHSLMDHGN